MQIFRLPPSVRSYNHFLAFNSVKRSIQLFSQVCKTPRDDFVPFSGSLQQMAEQSDKEPQDEIADLLI